LALPSCQQLGRGGALQIESGGRVVVGDDLAAATNDRGQPVAPLNADQVKSPLH
jgi:hypothetical protein